MYRHAGCFRVEAVREPSQTRVGGLPEGHAGAHRSEVPIVGPNFADDQWVDLDPKFWDQPGVDAAEIEEVLLADLSFDPAVLDNRHLQPVGHDSQLVQIRADAPPTARLQWASPSPAPLAPAATSDLGRDAFQLPAIGLSLRYRMNMAWWGVTVGAAPLQPTTKFPSGDGDIETLPASAGKRRTGLHGKSRIKISVIFFAE